MGLYNTIKLTTPPNCPLCGKAMRKETENGEFQSKETEIRGEWVDLTLSTYPIEEMTAGEIHGGCEHCESFVELEVRDGEIVDGNLRHPLNSAQKEKETPPSEISPSTEI